MSDVQKDDIALSFHKINKSVTIKGKTKFFKKIEPDTEKTILDNVSGYFNKGEMIAVMGPSGAGKTSLLEILADRSKPSNKDEAMIISYGEERDLHHQARDRPALVKQEDLLWSTATVKEILQFSARLRLPSSMTVNEKEEVVEKLLKELELYHIKDTIVGGTAARGISGGEKKRVAIGVEMATNPDLLFLDEPTSGLDASMALSVVKVLRKLCGKGKTVVCTIHQPRFEIFKEFDKLMLLARGKVIYFGSAVGATDYFADLGYKCDELDNPADFFLDLVHENKKTEEPEETKIEPRLSIENLTEVEEGSNVSNRIDQLIKNYEISESSEKVQKKLDNYKPIKKQNAKNKKDNESSSFEQFKMLSLRNIRTSYRDPILFWGVILMLIIFALFVSFLWYKLDKNTGGVQDRLAMFFYITVFITSVPAFMVIILFPSIRDIYNREISSGTYSVGPFLLSYYLFDIPKYIILCFIFTIITVFTMDLRSDVGSFFIYFLINFMVIQAGEASAIPFSALCKSMQEANVLYAIPMYFWMTFTPFFVNNDSIPKGLIFLPYTSYYKWTLEAYMVTELKDLPLECSYTPCPIKDETLFIGNDTIRTSALPGIEECVIPDCAYENGNGWLEFFDVEFDNVGPYLGILAGVIVFFRAISYFILKYVKVGKM